jgi:hypothetical protein
MEAVHVLCTMRFGDDLLEQLRAVSPRLRIQQETCHNAGEVATALQSHPGVEILYGLWRPACAGSSSTAPAPTTCKATP